ncbi:hypothetical protein [Sediminibacterium sp. C3]|uniref:hypothetical protein n=1 Tax=Sediminibacterium sp. C3 TaxID=1267211 RepID=UPI00042293F4|nr:hypothetical protein [Sediminibacterium sp. C3]
MKQIIAAILLFTLLATTSCKKETNNTGNPSNPYEPINVLQANAAFEHIWDTTMLMQTFGKYGMSDMTIENDHLFHFVYIQNAIGGVNGYESFYRNTVDLNSKKVIPLPKGAKQFPDFKNFVSGSGDMRQQLQVHAFRPYTNQYIMALMTYAGPRGSTYLHVSGDAGYNGLGGVVGQGHLGEFEGYFMEMGYRNLSIYLYPNMVYSFVGLNPNPNPYLLSGLNLLWGGFNTIGSYMFNNGNNIRPLFTEAERGKSTLFATTRDNNLIVAEYVPTDLPVPVFKETPATVVASVPYIPYYPSFTGTAKTYRHYSKDGKQMGLFVYHPDTKKYFSFVYNFQTKELRKVLDGASLLYGSETDSDIAFDEHGNMYYTGYANNGANKQGISIYKISNGSQTLVGSDNFLKFGEVIKIKYLSGIIYLAVQGRKAGTQVQQLSILKQK